MIGLYKEIAQTVTMVVEVNRADFCGQFYRWIAEVIPDDINKVLVLGNILMFLS